MVCFSPSSIILLGENESLGSLVSHILWHCLHSALWPVADLIERYRREQFESNLPQLPSHSFLDPIPIEVKWCKITFSEQLHRRRGVVVCSVRVLGVQPLLNWGKGCGCRVQLPCTSVRGMGEESSWLKPSSLALFSSSFLDHQVNNWNQWLENTFCAPPPPLQH